VNDHSENLGRRGFLTAVGLLGAASALSLGSAPAAGASPRTAPGDEGGHWSADRSANGWAVKDGTDGSDLYPAGARGGLFPREAAVVRDILAECEAVVRWGDDPGTPKEGHFQIHVRPGDAGLRRPAATGEKWNRAPGRGAGAVDPFTPARLRAARAMRARQQA
jgi:hypothetical protein